MKVEIVNFNNPPCQECGAQHGTKVWFQFSRSATTIFLCQTDYLRLVREMHNITVAITK